MKKGLWNFLAFVLITGVPLNTAALEVTNVRAGQISGTKQVEIIYDLKTDDGRAVAIRVEISSDGGATYNVKALTFSGDVGPSVFPGTGKRIVWDAGKDVPDMAGVRFLAKVVAVAGNVPVNGRIWFLSPKTSGSNDYEIYSMESDGTDARKEVELSSGFGFGHMSLNADGTEIAFVHQEESRHYKLKVRRVSGGIPTEVFSSEEEIRQSSWSPDGGKIVFAVTANGGDRLVVVDVKKFSTVFDSKLPLAGDIETKVGSNDVIYLRATAWSRDGSQILIVNYQRLAGVFTGNVYALKADGLGLRSTLHTRSDDYYPVVFSPDGSLIAYGRKDKGVFVSNPDGSRETLITGQKGRVVSWSPDGKEIVFEAEDKPALYRVKVDGTNLKVIPTGSGTLAPRFPLWVPR